MQTCTYENCENVPVRGSRCGHHSLKPPTEVEKVFADNIFDSKNVSSLQIYKSKAALDTARRLRSAGSVFKH